MTSENIELDTDRPLLHQFGHANRMGLARPTDHATDPVIFSQPSPTRVGSARPTDPASPMRPSRPGRPRPTDRPCRPSATLAPPGRAGPTDRPALAPVSDDESRINFAPPNYIRCSEHPYILRGIRYGSMTQGSTSD